jgi:hypothetical protein
MTHLSISAEIDDVRYSDESQYSTVEYRSFDRLVFSGTLKSLIGALCWRGVKVEGVEIEI